MVRRQYFEAIKAGTKRDEIRIAIPRWLTAAANRPKEAVFMCGREVHRRVINDIEHWASAEIYLGRPLSQQGIKDVGIGTVVVFKLGEPTA